MSTLPARLAAGGDVITAIDGRPVRNDAGLRGYVENVKHIGDKVTLTVSRDSKSQDISVTLVERRSQ